MPLGNLMFLKLAYFPENSKQTLEGKYAKQALGEKEKCLAQSIK